jgi:hypothetical protein
LQISPLINDAESQERTNDLPHGRPISDHPDYPRSDGQAYRTFTQENPPFHHAPHSTHPERRVDAPHGRPISNHPDYPRSDGQAYQTFTQENPPFHHAPHSTHQTPTHENHDSHVERTELINGDGNASDDEVDINKPRVARMRIGNAAQEQAIDLDVAVNDALEVQQKAQISNKTREKYDWAVRVYKVWFVQVSATRPLFVKCNNFTGTKRNIRTTVTVHQKKAFDVEIDVVVAAGTWTMFLLAAGNVYAFISIDSIEAGLKNYLKENHGVILSSENSQESQAEYSVRRAIQHAKKAILLRHGFKLPGTKSFITTAGEIEMALWTYFKGQGSPHSRLRVTAFMRFLGASLLRPHSAVNVRLDDILIRPRADGTFGGQLTFEVKVHNVKMKASHPDADKQREADRPHLQLLLVNDPDCDQDIAVVNLLIKILLCRNLLPNLTWKQFSDPRFEYQPQHFQILESAKKEYLFCTLEHHTMSGGKWDESSASTEMSARCKAAGAPDSISAVSFQEKGHHGIVSVHLLYQCPRCPSTPRCWLGFCCRR